MITQTPSYVRHRIGRTLSLALLLALAGLSFAWSEENKASSPPNVVLVMADDMGYAQTGYYDHPLLRTPNLDRLAAGGLRLDRFYAAGPVCSPTRASVLTGRSPERTGVPEHGYALRHQERTIVEAMRRAGYATGHFGKWHLDGFRGPGAPILEDDPFGPGTFGFETWLSVTNFFDRDPLMSRQGEFEAFRGDSSEIIVDEMLDFASLAVERKEPFLAIVWYGTPHSPFRASEADRESLAENSPERRKLLESMDEESRNQYGELVAMDRSLGTLRDGLESMGALENTLIWFCSDNGGLGNIEPSATAPLRGHKGMLYEGGIRVPAVLHWPARIEAGRVSDFPTSTVDIAPTLGNLLELPADSLLEPLDGISLMPIINGERKEGRPLLGFRYRGTAAAIAGPWKMIRSDTEGSQVYHLGRDVGESTDISKQEPEATRRLSDWLDDWTQSVDASIAGKDYPEGSVDPNHPEPQFWTEADVYRPYIEEWRQRPEYDEWIQRREQMLSEQK